MTDCTGAILPGVTVVVTNPETNTSREAVSDASGDFTILWGVHVRQVAGRVVQHGRHDQIRLLPGAGLELVVPTGAYRFGNSGRNILSGPGTVNINASLSRRFRLDKHRALQFRLESFNLPNRVNLGLPENSVDVPTAGSIRTAKNPRTMQVGLRFEF